MVNMVILKVRRNNKGIIFNKDKKIITQRKATHSLSMTNIRSIITTINTTTIKLIKTIDNNITNHNFISINHNATANMTKLNLPIFYTNRTSIINHIHLHNNIIH